MASEVLSLVLHADTAFCLSFFENKLFKDFGSANVFENNRTY